MYEIGTLLTKKRVCGTYWELSDGSGAIEIYLDQVARCKSISIDDNIPGAITHEYVHHVIRKSIGTSEESDHWATEKLGLN